ncbi:MAG: hypothetical protein OIN83_04680 [Candidatus Methanoperedens sp.]|nr:hypothetical protein [Candidatus Methanoperedens sp.]
MKKTLEKGGSVLKDAQDKKECAKDSINNGIQKVTSPLDKMQSQLDEAMNKIDEPFESLENKQMQAKMAVQASKEKAESKSKLDGVMNSAKSRADRAKSSIEDRQQKFQNLGKLIEDLKEKIRSMSEGAKVPENIKEGGT